MNILGNFFQEKDIKAKADEVNPLTSLYFAIPRHPAPLVDKDHLVISLNSRRLVRHGPTGVRNSNAMPAFVMVPHRIGSKPAFVMGSTSDWLKGIGIRGIGVWQEERSRKEAERKAIEWDDKRNYQANRDGTASKPEIGSMPLGSLNHYLCMPE